MTRRWRDLAKPAEENPASAVVVAIQHDHVVSDELRSTDLFDLPVPGAGLRRVRLVHVHHDLVVFPGFEFQELLEPIVGEREHAAHGLRADLPTASSAHLRSLELRNENHVEMTDEEERGLMVQFVDQILDLPSHAGLRLLHPITPVPVLFGPGAGNEIIQMEAEPLNPGEVPCSDLAAAVGCVERGERADSSGLGCRQSVAWSPQARSRTIYPICRSVGNRLAGAEQLRRNAFRQAWCSTDLWLDSSRSSE